MRYCLRKVSPRLATVKEIAETRDGDVAHLVSVNGRPLTAEEAQQEQARLDALYADPARQRHRQHGEEEDARVVFKLLRLLPQAFLYTPIGEASGPTGRVEKFAFRPNPAFHPSDLEAQALVSMTGELWVDAAAERVVHLSGRLEQDTNYGWGVLGKLDRGGWLSLDQAEVAPHLWRIARFQMRMNLRILFKMKNFDTTEEMSQYSPLPVGMDYRQAIQLLRGH